MALRWPLGLRDRARRSTGAPHHPPAAPAPPDDAIDASPARTHPDGAVNGHDVLAKVVALPVSTWRYRNDGDHVWHLGPMAQDWWAAFGLGGTDKAIHCIDANGVALVAIQALHREVESLRAELRRLRESSD
ncbi:tail fiber domain-containing protein [Nonomuraea sp. FMUSA5-5]|uniref:Tail fiber domain-containing protein n=1 Tax=Nonomuraea composti TaxID=2720023 RepID=A0ABX1BKV9_9ACTN|nr:tail fiber domain-containing protein [Nonomuraea sp. FMUSA5-5]NJP98378.1 tail fiber domain-containing protein [Nonomuraea sp. FMUSA5-5]